MNQPTPKLRLDKWLWHARFFKTRTLAAKQVSAGHVRVNADKVAKPAYGVVVGDVLTFIQAKRTRIVQIQAFGDRRGPAPEAQALYIDQSDPEEQTPDARTPHGPKFESPKYQGKGRPTKRDRRDIDALQNR